MKNELKKKSVVFLSKGFILTENEEKSIVNCCDSEILIFTYSEKGMKEGDVKNICDRVGSTATMVEIGPNDDIVLEKIAELGNELFIDLTNASNYHIMKLTSLTFLKEIDAVYLKDNEFVKVNCPLVDYRQLKGKKKEIITELSQGKKTAKEVYTDWEEKWKKSKGEDWYSGPNLKMTTHRHLNELYDNGYISKTEDKPAYYYLNEEQKYMMKLTCNKK